MSMVYCPSCSTKLIEQNISGRDRPFCPQCGYIFWGRHTVGVGGVLITDNKALLIQRAHDPGRGRWCIPGGYVETDEKIESAVQREIHEETGLMTEPIRLLGIRDYPADTPDTNHDVYFIFLMRFLGGVLEADNYEVSGAAFLTLEECLTRDTASLSLYFIKKMLQNTTPEKDFPEHTSRLPENLQAVPGFTRQKGVLLIGKKSELYSND